MDSTIAGEIIKKGGGGVTGDCGRGAGGKGRGA
jgi:hypothetical protein